VHHTRPSIALEIFVLVGWALRYQPRRTFPLLGWMVLRLPCIYVKEASFLCMSRKHLTCCFFVWKLCTFKFSGMSRKHLTCYFFVWKLCTFKFSGMSREMFVFFRVWMLCNWVYGQNCQLLVVSVPFACISSASEQCFGTSERNIWVIGK
jgi:hypothetical protein